MTSPTRLTGIYTPNVVPLDSSQNIDERELRRYVDWLIERGVHGLYPNGSTGEFTRFTAEERCRIISPFYYKLSRAGVYAYFKEIADHSPIDVTLYNIPMFASPIDVATVQRLAEECPRVVGIKGDHAEAVRSDIVGSLSRSP